MSEVNQTLEEIKAVICEVLRIDGADIKKIGG